MTQDYSKIPERIMENLLAYVKGDQVPGGFLYAVLSNDLFRAVGKADKEMKPLIPLLCQYIHWAIPGNCWGIEEIIKSWLNKKYEE